MTAGAVPQKFQAIAVGVSLLTTLGVEEAVELADARRMAHFPQRLGLDLGGCVRGSP